MSLVAKSGINSCLKKKDFKDKPVTFPSIHPHPSVSAFKIFDASSACEIYRTGSSIIIRNHDSL